MSVERTFQKDVDRFRLTGRKERHVLRPRPQTPEQELTLDSLREYLAERLTKIESRLKAVREELTEIKEFLVAFGFKYTRHEKAAKTLAKRRKHDRERQRRFQKRHGDEE